MILRGKATAQQKCIGSAPVRRIQQKRRDAIDPAAMAGGLAAEGGRLRRSPACAVERKVGGKRQKRQAIRRNLPVREEAEMTGAKLEQKTI